MYALSFLYFDVSSFIRLPTQAEIARSLDVSQDRLRAKSGSRPGKNIPFTSSQVKGSIQVQKCPVHRYPTTAICKEDEIEDPEAECDDGGCEDEDHSLAEDTTGTDGLPPG